MNVAKDTKYWQLSDKFEEGHNHVLRMVDRRSLKEQNKQYSLDIETEKMQTTNSSLCGFSHEISTPIGTARTATSAAKEKIKQICKISWVIYLETILSTVSMNLTKS